MSEYYIRQPDENEARGPYSVSKISDLIDSGKADRETLYYDETKDDWFPLIENPDLSETLFPTRRILNLKSKEIANALEQPNDRAPSLTVDELLAAAEGMTEDTKHLKSKTISMEKAAALSLPALGLIMFLSAVANIYPSIDILQVAFTERDYSAILKSPLLIVGLIDLFLSLCCFLSVTDAFPLLRFRAMLGLGYFGYIFWAWGEFPQMISVIAGSLAIYIATITLSFPLMLLCIIAGLAGMGTLAVMAIMG